MIVDEDEEDGATGALLVTNFLFPFSLGNGCLFYYRLTEGRFVLGLMCCIARSF